MPDLLICHQELADQFLGGKNIGDVLEYVKQNLGSVLDEGDAKSKIKKIQNLTQLRYKECYRKKEVQEMLVNENEK